MPTGHPAADEEPAVPSFAQESRIRAVGEDAVPGASLAKTVPAVCRLPEDADPDVLSHALRAVVRRHPALHHRFVHDDGGVRLEPVGTPVADLECAVTDEAGLPGAARARVRAEVDRPFDVLGWPLVRAGLVRGDRPLFYLSADHLVTDGGSALLALREVERIYHALLDGRDAALPPPGDFLAYSAAQRRRYPAGPRLDADLAGLFAVLAGRRVQPPFPVDATWDLTRGRHVTFDLLDGARTDALTGLCRTWRVTPFMAVLAAYGVAVRELCGHPELGVLIAVHNRDEPPARDGVGWFANMLPLYFPTGVGTEFADAVRAVRARLMELMPFHELPFALAQEAAGPADDGIGTLRPTCFMSYVDARPDERAGTWQQLDLAPAHRVGHGIWIVRRHGGLSAHIASPWPLTCTDPVGAVETRIADVLRAVVDRWAGDHDG